MISECSKQGQREYKNQHNWVGKLMYWELCKRLKFDRTAKLYMYKPESIQKNKTDRIHWDFEI